jgi:hypothetical protein
MVDCKRFRVTLADHSKFAENDRVSVGRIPTDKLYAYNEKNCNPELHAHAHRPYLIWRKPETEKPS